MLNRWVGCSLLAHTRSAVGSADKATPPLWRFDLLHRGGAGDSRALGGGKRWRHDTEDARGGGTQKTPCIVCPRQRDWSQCKCGGANVCPHQKGRSLYNDCGGLSLCEHQRERGRCHRAKSQQMQAPRGRAARARAEPMQVAHIIASGEITWTVRARTSARISGRGAKGGSAAHLPRTKLQNAFAPMYANVRSVGA